MENVVGEKIHITIQVDPTACSATVIIAGTVQQYACPDITRVLWRLKAISEGRPVVADLTGVADPDGTAVQTLQNVCTSLNFRTHPPAPHGTASTITSPQQNLRHDEQAPA